MTKGELRAHFGALPSEASPFYFASTDVGCRGKCQLLSQLHQLECRHARNICTIFTCISQSKFWLYQTLRLPQVLIDFPRLAQEI